MKARVKFPVGAQTTGAASRLEQQNALPALREVSRANQPVVSRSDDD